MESPSLPPSGRLCQAKKLHSLHRTYAIEEVQPFGGLLQRGNLSTVRPRRSGEWPGKPHAATRHPAHKQCAGTLEERPAWYLATDARRLVEQVNHEIAAPLEYFAAVGDEVFRTVQGCDCSVLLPVLAWVASNASPGWQTCWYR